jgi:membrane protease YdiL (CAAX protease family)
MTMIHTTIAPAGRTERKSRPRWPELGVGVIWFSAAILLAPPVSRRIPLPGDSRLLIGVTLVLSGLTAGLWVWQRSRGRESRKLGLKAAWQLGSVVCAWILLPPAWMASGVGLAVSAFYGWLLCDPVRPGDQA